MSIAGVRIENITAFPTAMAKKYNMRPSRAELTAKRLAEQGIIVNDTNQNVEQIIRLEDAISLTDVFLKRKLSNVEKRDREGERNRYMTELNDIYDKLRKKRNNNVIRGAILSARQPNPVPIVVVHVGILVR